MMHNDVAPSHLNSSDSRLNIHIPPLCQPPAERRGSSSAAENREVPGTSLDLGTVVILGKLESFFILVAWLNSCHRLEQRSNSTCVRSQVPGSAGGWRTEEYEGGHLTLVWILPPPPLLLLSSSTALLYHPSPRWSSAASGNGFHCATVAAKSTSTL